MQELLTATEVQELLEVDRSTVYRMASDGRLPAVKIGRQWRFPAAEIHRLLVFPGVSRPEIDPHTAEQVIRMASEALGVMMVVTDLEGRPVTPVVNPCARFLALEDDPAAVATCALDWREMAVSPDPRPRLEPGRFGFLCARSFIRVDGRPAAMVLAGGVAPEGEPADDLFVLNEEQRRRVVSTLPRVASVLTSLTRDQRSTA